MLLHSTISQSPPHPQPMSLPQSSPLSNSLNFPSGFRNSPFKRPQFNPLIIRSCSSSTPVPKANTGDSDKKQPGTTVAWKAVYKRISKMGSFEKGSTGVLNQWENEGKSVTKWELRRLVKELRKYRHFKLALEVYEWMNNRPERFAVSASDAAIQLDLVSKVHGLSAAESYFKNLPDGLVDNRAYGSLLNAYVTARMTEKAEALLLEMKSRRYAYHALPYNVMMTLYMNLKDHERVEALVDEMTGNGINLDLYTYNIWISSRGARGSVEGMEDVFEKMRRDLTLSPNWTTYSTMATKYIKMGEIEKAEGCLRKIEAAVGGGGGGGRVAYHYLLSHYGGIGRREEVKRVWETYKTVFPYIPNMGYHAAISAFVRMDDIEAAEGLYEEWMSVKTSYDPRVGNRLLGWYVGKGLYEKAEAFLDRMLEVGKSNSFTWEIAAEGRIGERRAADAVACYEKAVSDEAAGFWTPNPAKVSNLYEICDEAGKKALLAVLERAGVLDDKAYVSNLPFLRDSSTGNELVGVKESQSAAADNDDDVVLDELHAAV